MKDITIHYNNKQEYDERGTIVSILFDGIPIKDWKSFSITVSPNSDPVYTIEQIMDYPTDKDYLW